MGNLMMLGFTPWPDPTPEEYAEMAVGVQYHRQEAARTWDSKRPLEIIQKLAQDPDETIRGGVVRNPFTPVSVLTELLSDPSESVRMGIAKRKDLPESIREKLAQDESELVRLVLAGDA